MKIKTKKIIIGKSINQEIFLPVLKIGQGKPILGLVTGVHGNEPEGLFVIRELIRNLKKFNGTLKILPGANPQALTTNTRVNLFDFGDLNRSFPGNKKGTLTERVAVAIFEEFSDCDTVLDIHSVTNLGAFMGMELSSDDPKIIAQTQRINRLLNPPVIWKAVEGSKYTNALDESLIKIGVCGVGVEIPRLEFLNKRTLKKIVFGILKVVENPKKVGPLKKAVPVLANAQRFFSDLGGIYNPVAKLSSRVKKGDVIGTITDLETFKDTSLKSEFSGTLFVQSTKKIVKTGDKIYAVTEKIGEFK